MRARTSLIALAPLVYALACTGEKDAVNFYVDGEEVPAAGNSTSGAGSSTAATGGSGVAAGGSTTGAGGAMEAGTGGVGSGGPGPSAGGSPDGSGGAQPTGSGGSEPDGGGGSPTATPGVPYAQGFTPTTVSVEDAREAYENWKTYHLEDCGDGVWRVPWDIAKADGTVSEGIGYGMLLTLAFGDKAAFDGLHAYYKMALGDTGLMNWLRYGCDAHYDTKYSQYPNGAAADADLDVAMALIQAECKWGDGDYANKATEVIVNIRNHMFTGSNGMNILLPGDSAWYHEMGASCLNYSYMAPAYYREFAKFDTSEAAFWNQAAGDTYTLLAAASNGTSGLVRNWGSADGGSPNGDCESSYHSVNSYGDDAARTPWRVVTDYLWNGTPEAKVWNDKVTSWLNTLDITQTVQWYTHDGQPDVGANSAEHPYDDHTVINVGPWATGAMAYDQESVDKIAAEVIAIPWGPDDHDGEYFQRMLKPLSLITLMGHFDRCGGSMP